MWRVPALPVARWLVRLHSTFPRSHVPRSHVPRSHVPTFRGVSVNEWGTNKRMGRVPALPVARWLVRPHSTFPRSHVPRSTFARSAFHVPILSPLSTNGERINECGRAPCASVATLARLHSRSTFHIRTFARSCLIPAVNEWGTNKRMGRVPALPVARWLVRTSHVLRCTFARSTFHVSSFHPPRPLRSGRVCTGWFDHSASQGTWRNTITDVRPQGSGACSTFRVRTFNVPTFHVSSFHPPRPLRSGRVCTGWFDHSASQGTWQNTITDVRPQGSGACSTFARSHVQRSHVPRSTFLPHPRCQRMGNE